MKTLNVDLGERSYPIYIGPDLILKPELVAPFVKGKQVVIVSNETIAPLYLEATLKLFSNYQTESVILKDGEQFKTLEGIKPIIDLMMEKNIDRKVTLVALGGGVIGDMTGFAASIYRRGVNFIQIPTTLLAQVDSSVGGKTGVNHPLGKNMIGAFHQPQCVIADTNTLNTLDDRQLSAGLGEVIKYAFINDIEFLDWLENNVQKLLQRDAEALSYAIEVSCIDKANIVAEDEKEAGKRALLNLGHTFGHAIETGLGYGTCLHGEAISIGMLMAADLSMRHGWIEQASIDRIKAILQAAQLPIAIPDTKTAEKLDSERFIQFMAGDKKVLDGTLHLVLFKNIGESIISSDYEQSKLLETLDSFT